MAYLNFYKKNLEINKTHVNTKCSTKKQFKCTTINRLIEKWLFLNPKELWNEILL